jgi:hypothetical protein
MLDPLGVVNGSMFMVALRKTKARSLFAVSERSIAQ